MDLAVQRPNNYRTEGRNWSAHGWPWSPRSPRSLWSPRPREMACI